MYNLTEIRKPLQLNFSRNPIICSWHISPYTAAETSLNTILTVKVEVYSNTGLNTKVFKVRPDSNGKAEIDVQSFIDLQLQYEMPNIANQALSVSTSHICRFAISTVLTNDYEQLGLTEKKWFFAFKGGFPKDQNNLSNYLADNILVKKQMLRYPINGETKDVSELFVLSALAYLNDNSHLISAPGSSELSYQYRGYINLTPDPWTEVTSPLSANFAETVHLPFRIKDKIANHSLYNAVEIQILLKIQNITHVIGQQLFYLEDSKDLSPESIYWYNSQGGIDNIATFRVDEKQWNYSLNKAEYIDINEFAGKNVIKAQYNNYAITERATPKIKTHPLTQQELDRLRALFLSNTTYLLRNNLLIPISINDSNLSITSVEGLFTLGLTWNEGIINQNYLPENSIVTPTTCPIPILFTVSHNEANMVTVHYAFEQNQYSGLLSIKNQSIPGQLPFTLELDNNEGVINIDVAILNPNNELIYTLTVGLKTECGDDHFSNELSQLINVRKVSPPTLPTLYAQTYEGSGFRTLSFQNNDTGLLSLSSSNNPSAFRIVPAANEFSNIMFAGSNAGGAFNIIASNTIIGLNGQMSYTVSYSPMNNFRGNDIIKYWAWALNSNNPSEISIRREGRIYVNVGGDQEGNTGGSSGGALTIYVRWDIEENSPMNVREVYNTKWFFLNSYLRFFSDPYGNNPIDVTGMGIIVKIYSEYNGDAGNLASPRYVAISGIATYTEAYIKKTFKKKKVSEFSENLEETNQYYVIL